MDYQVQRCVGDSMAPKTVRGDMRMQRLVWAVVALVLLTTGVGLRANLVTSHLASHRVTSTQTPSPRHSVTAIGRSGATRRGSLVAAHHASRRAPGTGGAMPITTATGTPTAGATDTATETP